MFSTGTSGLRDLLEILSETSKSLTVNYFRQHITVYLLIHINGSIFLPFQRSCRAILTVQRGTCYRVRQNIHPTHKTCTI